MQHGAVIVSSAKPGTCCGCGGNIPDGATITWVGQNTYHNRDCYDMARPPADVWRERCREVERAEYSLELAKRRRDEAARRMSAIQQ